MNYRQVAQCGVCGLYEYQTCPRPNCSFSYTSPPRGCICPPTSEQTCRSPSCPRQPLQVGAALGLNAFNTMAEPL